MKKIKKILPKIIIILIVLLCSYYYEDIEKYIKHDNQENISNVISTTDALEISYIDVGQADCILIRNNDKNILIDAGNESDGEKLVTYFKEQGINKFSYVFATHAHEDHIGGMDDILNNFKTDHFMMPDVVTTTKTFEEVIDSLENNNIVFETPEIDQKINIGEMTIDILSVGNETEDLNDTSIVMKLNYHNTNYIFTGDASTKVENQIINKNLKADVLKVGHHGSQYSSSAKFLKAVDPTYAIIEVGKNNIYDHPKEIVLKKLDKIGAKIYRTDKDGTIILTSDGNNINIKTKQTDTDGGSK